jgi:hypothetical protein
MASDIPPEYGRAWTFAMGEASRLRRFSGFQAYFSTHICIKTKHYCIEL